MGVTPKFIVSKNRWDKCLTAKALDLMGVDFKIIVERDQRENYANNFGSERVIVLPEEYLNNYDTCDDLGRTKSVGPGAARNFALDLTREMGEDYHWVMDDNLHDFHRLHKNEKIPVRNDVPFRATEDFVKRYKNVPLAGLNYYSFCKTTDAVPPFVANTRIYSCLLIRSDIKHRWRGRYNEDTDLSLNVLKDGDCTIQMNAFLCGKVTTQRMKGGNTDEFYSSEGTKPKSEMLAKLHPDVAKVVWRFNRWHHHVDYSKFQAENKLQFVDDYSQKVGINNYGLELRKIDIARKDETPSYWR